MPAATAFRRATARTCTVDGLIFANEKLLDAIRKDQAAEQVANVATLPGIQSASFAMPDIHWGYGFCIGGVAATDPAEGGVISPGGVGYDINCGVRLVKTNLFLDEVKHHIRDLVKALHYAVPAGAGRGGKYKFDSTETRRLMGEGPRFVVNRDLGVPRDLDHTEANGRIEDADPHEVTDHAVKRGSEQCGTLGSGNHFLEVQVVDSVFDADVAKVFGLELNQVCVMIHSGSRGLGYQVCDNALAQFRNCPAKYGITLPDRQLACTRPSPRRARSTSPRCGPPRTTASATANCSCSRPAKCSPRSSAARGRTSAWNCSTTWPTISRSSKNTPWTAGRRRFGFTARAQLATSLRAIPKCRSGSGPWASP